MRVSTHRIRTIAALLSLCLPAHAADQQPITLTISGPQTIPAGQKIEIDAVLTNVSKDPVRLVGGVPYTVQIHNEHGKVPPLKPGIWMGSGGSMGVLTLQPGKPFTQSVGGYLNKYDLSAPGAYVVRATYPLAVVDRPVPPQQVIQQSTLESNEITIRIVAKSPDAPKDSDTSK